MLRFGLFIDSEITANPVDAGPRGELQKRGEREGSMDG